MTLRAKTLVVFCGALATLFVTLFIATRVILWESFEDIEEDAMRKDVQSVRNLVVDEIASLDRMNSDWVEQIAANMPLGAGDTLDDDFINRQLIAFDTNLVVTYISSGDILFSRALDLAVGSEVPLPAEIQEPLLWELPPHHSPAVDTGSAGVMLLSEHTLLAVYRPIRIGDILEATLFVARYVDEAKVRAWSSTASTPVEVFRVNTPDIPPDVQKALAAMRQDSASTYVAPINDSQIAGYARVDDIFGNVALVIRTHQPRRIHEQGQNTFNSLALSLALAAIVFGVGVLGVLERSMLSRLARLSEEIRSIGKRNDRNGRVTANGNDELATLAAAINETLDALQRSRAELGQSQTLLKEIHHRIKNNLQVISSLLRLQSYRINDDAVRMMLADSQHRIRSIALIHEKLYHAEYLEQINFEQYLQDLLEYLQQSYSGTMSTINMLGRANGVMLSIDRAIPCALIINELVTNAIKHAFPNGQTGTVNVEVQQQANGACILTVHDNGVGIPEHIDLHNTETLGLQLVTTLAHQLDGEVAYQRSGGTTFTLTFPGHS